MKSLGAKALHKSLLLGLGAIFLHTACSNSNFRSTSASAVTEEPASSEDAAPVEDNGITTAPISSSDLDVPAALKEAPDSLFSSFPTSALKNAETQFTLDLKDVSTTVKLEDKLAKKTENFAQNTRNLKTEMFTQGTPGETKTDEFTQAGKKGLVDILVVIDNSGSMNKEQENLSTKLNELLVSIKDADWQVSVINTSPSVPAGVNMNNANSEGKEICVSTLIKKADVTAAADFAKAVQAGINGNGNEQGIRQAVVGLRCPGKTVVRPMSTLAVLIVSDEDNCSFEGNGCGSLPWSKETYLINYVENTLQRTVGKNAGFYGLVAPNAAVCPTLGNPAPQYIRLFDYKSTPGVNYGNICDASYKTTLNRISDNIALQLDSTFELKNTPDAGTLSVSVTSPAGAVTAINPNDYTLMGKTLKFAAGKEPANGSTIKATYKIGVKPMFNSVTLLEAPAAGTVTVKVNGNPLAAGFSVAGRVVSFNPQPPANATVSIDYRQNTALIDRVKLASVPVNGTITVKVNKVATNNFNFDAGQNVVVLGQIPLDGQTIEVTYTLIEGPILTYKVSIMAGSKNFRLLDGATAVNHTVNQAAGEITIDRAAFQSGKTLTFIYEVPDGAERRFPLVGKPEAGTLNISMMAGTCVLGKDLIVSADGMELISKCAVTEKTEFILSYKYKALVKSFTVSGITDPDKGSWAVYYNGELETDYTRTGSTVTLNFEPVLDSKVDIVYTFPE
jgi:hypothetical protein